MSDVQPILQIDPSDNVAVALQDLSAGQIVGAVKLLDAVPRGHKVAVRPIASGQAVVKYGYPIGRATRDIAAGEHVHCHNIASSLQGNLADLRFAGKPAAVAPAARRTFQGYRRNDGRVGIRNEVWIICTVGCINHAAEKIAHAAQARFAGSGVDGVYTFAHPFGCSQLGGDLANTQRVLAGLIRHPNAGGVLVLGLGCENNQMKLQLAELGEYDSQRVKFFNAQEVEDEFEKGMEVVGELVEYASKSRREPVDAGELILGMKCGGSDGLSGITANPLVGRVADRLSALGGTTILTEVPEMFGAEAMLLERAESESTFNGTLKMVNDFREYFRSYNEPIDENPSPGNKEGGISTLAEKSLGCVQKGGRAPVKQVVGYGQSVRGRSGGIALINAPGNDGVSGTAMTVAGAHMILFTTGRGTPMGFPAPTVKIATNSALAGRKPNWIDFNAGALVDGVAMDSLADALLEQILDVASGKVRTRNEINGYREIAIWKNGVTL